MKQQSMKKHFSSAPFLSTQKLTIFVSKIFKIAIFDLLIMKNSRFFLQKKDILPFKIICENYQNMQLYVREKKCIFNTSL